MYVTSSLGPTQLVCNIEINNLVGTCITYYIYIYTDMMCLIALSPLPLLDNLLAWTDRLHNAACIYSHLC